MNNLLRFVFSSFFVMCTLATSGLTLAVEISPQLPAGNDEWFVTVVVEDAAGKRIRNLVPSAPITALNAKVNWDGLDDSGKAVAPGTYRWRGIYHPGLDAKFEFAFYNSGSPTWQTERNEEGFMGGWGADHGVPSSVATDPTGKDSRIFLSFSGQEAGSWLMSVNKDGRKTGADSTTWKGADWIAVDASDYPQSRILYARDEGSYPGNGAWVVQLARWPADSAKPLLANGELRETYDLAKGQHNLCGIAAGAGKVYVSLNYENRIGVYSVGAYAKFSLLKNIAVAQPRGIALDKDGHLLAVSGQSVVRIDEESGKITPVITKELTGPYALAVDAQGRILVADVGEALAGTVKPVNPQTEMRVKLFSSDGTLLKTMGTAGGRKIGPWDENAMQSIGGIAADGTGQVWVAESSLLLKRFSVWNPENGKFVRDHLGPPLYGGAGTLDPLDPSHLFYAGLEYKADWKTGSVVPSFWHGDHFSDASSGMSNVQIIHHQGHEYLINFNGHSYWDWPTSIHRRQPDGRYVPAATLYVKRDQPFIRVWSDSNGDGAEQDNEAVKVDQPVEAGVIKSISYKYVGPDLSYWGIGNWQWQKWSLWRWKPRSIDANGVPHYDPADQVAVIAEIPKETVIGGVEIAAVDSGGRVYLFGYDARPGLNLGTISCLGADMKCLWTYPVKSQGHAEYNRHFPPGSLIHVHKFSPLADPGTDALGPILCPVTADGQRHFLSSDGLFIGSVFRNAVRDGSGITPSTARRDQSLNGMSLPDEQWGDHFVQTRDGKFYLFTAPGYGGSGIAVIRIEGLDQVKRLAGGSITLGTEKAVVAAPTTLPSLTIAHLSDPPRVDGKLADWPNATWTDVPLDSTRGFRARLGIDAKYLYITFDVRGNGKLRNAGTDWRTLFKSGGGVDVQLGLDPKADPLRTTPVGGDLRLFISLLEGKPIAVLYRPVNAEPKQPGTFESPVGKVTFDDVRQLPDAQISIVDSKEGYVVEAAVSRASINLLDAPGDRFIGDVGVIFADPTGTKGQIRHYWSNKDTFIVDDLPSEARLRPERWNVIQAR